MTNKQGTFTDKDRIDELIIDYLTESITSDDVGQLTEWRNARPENEAYFRQIQEIWFSISAGQSPHFSSMDAQAGYREFLKRMEACQRPALSSAQQRHFRWMRYAAAITLLTVCSYLAYRQGNLHVLDNSHEVRIEAPAGSYTLVNLPDGTRVRLGGESYLLYSPRFGADDRKVTLVGEGYFEVAHNEEIPFHVHSHDLNVQVLGTKFNFRNYPEDKQAVVTLSEGKVSLQNLIAQEQQIMHPGEQAILNKQSGTLTLNKVNRENGALLPGGKLSFDEVPMSEVMKALERRYGIQFTIAHDTLKDLRFYGEFNTDTLTLEQVMELLSSTRQLRYRIEGKQVTVY